MQNPLTTRPQSQVLQCCQAILETSAARVTSGLWLRGESVRLLRFATIDCLWIRFGFFERTFGRL